MKKNIPYILVLCGLLLLGHNSACAKENMSLKDLAIPEFLGKVEQRIRGTSDFWVVHIQDVHAHFAAQENIAAIVDHLNRVYGIEMVGLEGGWTGTSFKKSWGIPNSRAKQMLARALLERDLLSGPAYAALFSETPIHLFGVEDKDLYLQNHALYIRHLEKRESILESLKVWDSEIAALKKQTYNSSLYAFDQKLELFREGKDTQKFLPELVRMSSDNQIKINDLDQILLFGEILHHEELLPKAKLQSESERIMKQYKQTGLNFEELIRSGKIPEEKLEFYSTVRAYIALIELKDKLEPLTFFDQIETAVTRLKDALFTTDEEKRIDRRSFHKDIAKKIILFEATPKDLKNYVTDQINVDAESAEHGLSGALKLGVDFYAVAKERDRVFAKKIMDRSSRTKNVALVTGGFHAEGIAKKLVDAGISYIQITPELAGSAPDQELYFKRLRAPLPQTQTLAALIETTFFHPRFDDPGFPAAQSELLTSRNILKAIEVLKSILGGVRGGDGASLMEKPDAVSMEAFMKLDEKEQIDTAKRLAATVSSAPLAALGMQVDFTGDSVSVANVQWFRSNPLHRLGIGVPQGSIAHEVFLGGRSRSVFRVAADTIDDFLTNRRTGREIKSIGKDRVVIISDNRPPGSGVVLPPENFILRLVPAILEGNLIVSSDPAVISQFLARIKEIFMTLELQEATRRAA